MTPREGAWPMALIHNLTRRKGQDAASSHGGKPLSITKDQPPVAVERRCTGGTGG